MHRAIASCSRAQTMISSPGWLSSSLGRSTSIGRLFSGNRVQRIAGEAVHRPFRVRFCAEALIESNRVAVPIKHRPLQPAAITLDRDLRQTFEQGPPYAAPALLGNHEQILEIDSRLGEKRREVGKEERKA